MFDRIVNFLSAIDPVTAALYATVFTWLCTAAGAAVVFFIKTMNRAFLDGMLGFTGGVMIAASVWSLIIPAIDISGEMVAKNLGFQNINEASLSYSDKFELLIPVIVGVILGTLFLFLLDKYLPHLHLNFPKEEKEGLVTNWHRTTLLTLAITLHNIPEGLAVGVLFGAAANFTGIESQEVITSATLLAIGIGLQNFPEGLAVSMPLRRAGLSRWKSFFYGQLSAIVEPVAGVLGALAVSFFTPLLPYALAYAAGAMLYVVVEEVIPETQRDKYTDIATLGFILGFLVMMSLDVALG